MRIGFDVGVKDAVVTDIGRSKATAMAGIMAGDISRPR